MIEPAVIVLRLVQYVGAMILLGSSVFFLRALPQSGPGSAEQTPWARSLLTGAAAVLCASALLWIAGQAALLAGSVAEGLKPETLLAVVTGFDLGKAALIRAAAAALGCILVVKVRPARTAWLAGVVLGLVATTSFAWTGHGASTEGAAGPIHLASDIVHSWAAAAWIGALVAFLLLLSTRTRTAETTAVLHRALQGFSGLGALLVAALVLTGLVNSAVLVGLQTVEGLWTTPYGRLLSLKLLLFAGMLGLAAKNRFKLTPALGRALETPDGQEAAVAALRRSVLLETALGLAVVALVAWFGTLPPPSSH